MNINDIKAALAQRANGLKMPVMTGATAPQQCCTCSGICIYSKN